MFKYKNIFRFSFLVIAFVFIAAVALAQNERLNYQGVARNADGSPKANQAITVNLSIGSSFSELHSVTTNSFGLFTIAVGSINTTAFATINWSTPQSLRVEINSVSMGLPSPLNYVPYALYANQLKGFSYSNTAPSSGQVLKWNGTAWAPGIDNGSVTAELPIKTSLVSGVTNLFIELSNGNILVGDATNKAAVVTMSGDVTLSNTGVATIGSGKVSNGMLQSGINATKLADGSVDNTKLQYINTLASNAQTQLDAKQTSTLSNGNILVGDATNKAAAVTMSGDVTLSNTGVATIGSGKVSNGMLQSGINATKLADGSVDNTKLQYINTLASNAQTQLDAKQTSTLSNGNILVGDATNKAAAVTMSGDVTLSNTGVATIANDAITTTKLLNGNVTYAKIQNVSSSDKVLGRVSSGAGAIEEISTSGTGDVVRANSPTLTGNITASGPVAITNTTTSNSTSTGALVISGGVGIGSNLYVDGVANFRRSFVQKDVNYQLKSDDYYVINKDNPADIYLVHIFTLPSATGNPGKEYFIKNLSVNMPITINPTGTDKIIDYGSAQFASLSLSNLSGVTTNSGYVSSIKSNWVKLVSDGSGNWIVFSSQM